MLKSVAFAADTLAMVAWSSEAAIPECLGFSIRRIGSDGQKKALPSWVPFEGQDNSKWEARTTDQWPAQRFTWKDFTAKPGESYQYEIVPMVGTKDTLKAREDLATRTNKVTVGTACGPHIQARFTRGILSTQSLAHKLPAGPDGSPDFQTLLRAINTPGDPIRNSLSGGMQNMLLELHRRAKAEGGRVYEALYELSDPELMDGLLANKDGFSMILSNTGKDDETNHANRQKLHEGGYDVIDRMLSGMSIGHNKSGVLVDKHGKPLCVRTGSTNWTPTGLCCQSNNELIIDSPELGQQYLDYWNLLKADGHEQGDALRKACAQRRKEVELPDGTRITAWFSPNTLEREKPKTGAAAPPDLAEVFDCMDKAKHQIFFLAFYPGFPSFLTKITSLNRSRRDLLLRGAVSNPQAMPNQGVQLYHRKGTPPVIVAASGLEKQLGAFRREILKLPDSHAIIHDKVIVIDPMSPDCVVITGSHNLGYKASYQNDENLLIIRNNQALAQSYMVHVLSVFEHYSFRWSQASGHSKFTGFLSPQPTWQDRFMTGAAHDEMLMWTGAKKLCA